MAVASNMCGVMACHLENLTFANLAKQREDAVHDIRASRQGSKKVHARLSGAQQPLYPVWADAMEGQLGKSGVCREEHRLRLNPEQRRAKELRLQKAGLAAPESMAAASARVWHRHPFAESKQLDYSLARPDSSREGFEPNRGFEPLLTAQRLSRSVDRAAATRMAELETRIAREVKQRKELEWQVQDQRHPPAGRSPRELRNTPRGLLWPARPRSAAAVQAVEEHTRSLLRQPWMESDHVHDYVTPEPPDDAPTDSPRDTPRGRRQAELSLTADQAVREIRAQRRGMTSTGSIGATYKACGGGARRPPRPKSAPSCAAERRLANAEAARALRFEVVVMAGQAVTRRRRKSTLRAMNP
jgi:hypothetical protein